jgi:putative cell wall-binding protein
MTSSDIFDGGITVYGQKNTTAQSYAQKYGHTFKEISTPLVRFAGVGRYDTAKAISVEGSVASSKIVVLAYGLGYADALAGVPLASALGAPILLTTKDALPQETLGEIKRLGANKVIILGGEGAVSKSVENVLKNSSITVERCEGATRFETATKIACKLNTAPSDIFFVYGFDFADALSVSPIAARRKAPIIYLRKDGQIDSETMKYLSSVKGHITAAYVIGGTAVVSDSMLKKAAQAVGLQTARRLSGANRYETCIAVNTGVKNVFAGNTICVATGKSFPDALAGGVFAADALSPMFLADTVLSDKQKEFLNNISARTMYILGGKNAVPDDLGKKIALSLI